jgi:hypothetical protein
LPIEPTERALRLDLLFDVQRDRVIEISGRRVDAAFKHRALIQAPTCLQSRAPDRLITPPIRRADTRAERLRIGKRRRQAHCARHILIDVRRVGDQSHSAIISERVTKVDRAAHLILTGMHAEAVCPEPARRREHIPWSSNARDLRGAAHGAERAAFKSQ